MMATLLITVEINSIAPDTWRLQVVNTITGKTFECESLEAMNETVTTLSGLYPEHELRVEWLKSPRALPHHINALREQIKALEKTLETS
jgi:hypothetical protein